MQINAILFFYTLHYNQSKKLQSTRQMDEGVAHIATRIITQNVNPHVEMKCICLLTTSSVGDRSLVA